MPLRILSLLLCLLVAGPISPAAHAVARPETRVEDFFPSPLKSAPADLDQTAGLRWENRGCGYDFASGVCKYLYAHANPVNRIDPSGMADFNLASLTASIGTIATLAGQQLSAIVQRTGPMFQAGARQAWEARQLFGRFAENTANQVIRLVQSSVSSLGVQENIQRGSRFIDFALRYGQRVMDLEVQYKLPDRAGEALSRMVSQAQASVAAGEAQTVIWTFKEPTLQELQLVTTQLGAAASRVQFVNGVEGLLRYIELYFGF